jgi:hypothetical protein
MDFMIGCLSGLFATLAMDCLGILTIKRKWLDLKGIQVVPLLLGRWALLSFRAGEDIRVAAPLTHEKKIGLLLHYGIGALLGGAYGLLPKHNLEIAALYGVATNVFPWLFMYPAMGFGFFASKLGVQKPILLFSFVNHVVYGFALGLVFGLLHP